MLIQPLPNKSPVPTASHFARWLGLYLLLAFSGLYLLGVLWAQHSARKITPVQAYGRFAVVSTTTQTPPCPTATPLHHVYGRFGAVNTAPQAH